ncbi:MAG: outer membrane beta-barrel protein [Saprospiraceae bacterium]|nr:outer membrane beta-barrel protein [Saprospiraceae bacterium]
MIHKTHIDRSVCFLLILFFILSSQKISGQAFKASAIVGANLSQIDGDNEYGFRKIGLTAGGKIGYGIDKNKFVNLEFLYSERGSSTTLFASEPESKIVLRYIEVPIIFSIHDWYKEEKKYHVVRADLGFSYGNLFQLETPIGDPEAFRNHDFSYILGAGFQFSKRIGLCIRYTRSLNKMLDYTDVDGKNITFEGYFLTTRMEYQF